MDWDRIIERIYDPVFQAEHALRLAEVEATRSDPWRWYCRICGAQGLAAERKVRDDAAQHHLAETPCGRHEITGWAETGRLAHVWTYPAWAAR